MTRWDLDDDVESLDDTVLVGRIAAGDERALMVVYDRHGAVLFGAALRFLGDRETAAEVVQETFLALWQRAARFDPGSGQLLGWLIGITRFRSLDRARAESRRPPRVEQAWATRGHRAWEAGERPQGSSGVSSAVEELDPAGEVDRRWTRAVVRNALSALAEQEREVLVLAYDEGLSQSEIAARTGWPLGTVKSRTRRALATLREQLGAIPDLVVE